MIFSRSLKSPGKKKFFFCLFIFAGLTSPMHGEWDPQKFADEISLSDTSMLNDFKFIQLKQSVADYLIDSWCSKEKINLMMDLVFLTKPKVCVEIGVFTGSSFLPVAATLSFLNSGMAYAIDSWSNFDATQGISKNDHNYYWWSTVDMGDIVQKFLNTMQRWRLFPFILIIPDTSRKASSQFHQIDFLHFDGSFSEVVSLEDVMLYLPKVSSGGYILFSNLFMKIDNKYTKMKALWLLLQHCEIIAEIENSNAILFQKK